MRVTREEAESFRTRYGLSQFIPTRDIAEVMDMARRGELKTICTPCYEGEHAACWKGSCECCKEADA